MKNNCNYCLGSERIYNEVEEQLLRDPVIRMLAGIKSKTIIKIIIKTELNKLRRANNE